MYSNEFLLLVAKKLSGEASAQDLQQLEQILQQHPEWMAAAQNLADVWPYDTEAVHIAPSAAYSRHLERMHQMNIPLRSTNENKQVREAEVIELPIKKSVLRLKVWVAAAACAAVMAAAWWALPLNDSLDEAPIVKKEVVTVPGTKTRTLLPDGTTVWLNAASKLVYNADYGKDKREVSLQGEGYFDVVKDAKHPFIVHTDVMDIRVLGTAFNVKSYPGENEVEATLIRGSIQVTKPNDPTQKITTLKPNEKLVMLRSDMLELPSASTASKLETPVFKLENLQTGLEANQYLETAWMYNRLEFRGDSFSELAGKLQRWYNVQIVFDDSAVKNLRFNGSFENENIVQALDALKLAKKFNYKIANNAIHITSQY